MKDIHIFNNGIRQKAEEFKLVKGDKIVSYSQFSTYDTCPKSWELANIKGHKEYSPNIYTIFGSAIHTVIQTWLTTLYQKGVKKSEELDLSEMLRQEMSIEYKKEFTKFNNVHFSTKQELYEFWEDGCEILTFLRKKRTKYFTTRKMEFVGFEIPILLTPNEKIPNVKFQAYLDLVFKDLKTNHYFIIDIKTSTRGWKEWDKKNATKISQVLLYKTYFSEIFKVPIENITVSYLILKRKLIVNSEYPQSRIQEFSPAQGSISVKKAKTKFLDFVNKTFTLNGERNTEIIYPAYAGKEAKNCKFCPFAKNYELCPIERRIEDI